MWKIGDVELANRVVLAPMAGITDLPFRLIAKDFGCALVYGQLVSAKAITYKNKKTAELLTVADRERPVGLQLFGSQPETMAEAATFVANARPDLIDINMGCPVPKVVDNDDGCALMRDPQKAGRVVQSVVKAVALPVTVKIRKGWDENNVTAVEVAREVEKAGAAAIAVHGRTRSQFYSGKADWSIIAAVKQAVRIPVIGNGDVQSPEDAKRMLEETGCDAVMIGRAALGNPWLIRQVTQYLSTGRYDPGPQPAERVEMALCHMRLALELKGERSVFEMRKQLAWYLKGLPNANRVKQSIMSIADAAQVLSVLSGFRDEVSQSAVERP